MNDKKKCRSVNFFNIIATEEHKGLFSLLVEYISLQRYLLQDVRGLT